MTGAKKPDNLDGISVLPVLYGNATGEEHAQRAFYWEFYESGIGIRRDGQIRRTGGAERPRHGNYLEAVVRKGIFILLSCSDPKNKTVAPFGGQEPVYSPNPIAAGIPTQDDPILFDISMSTTANGLVAQKHKSGERLPHSWLLDYRGRPTDDPAAFFENPPATILPLGGMDAGYKGFALGILVEALTNGLSGHGRSDEPGRWGASVFLQLINPEAFGGLVFLKKEMTRFAENCLATKSIPDGTGVRLPGSKALTLKKNQLEQGIVLLPAVWHDLIHCAEQYDLKMPEALHNFFL